MRGAPRPARAHPLPPVGDVLEFLRLIWAVDHALQSSSKRMQANIGLTGPQRLALRMVGRFPGIPAGHLARLFHVHPSTLTGVLTRLEQKRLIRRRADPSDGRRVLLALTRRGRALARDASGTIEEAIRTVIERTPSVELEAARRVLHSVAHALNTRSVTGPVAARGSRRPRRRPPASPAPSGR